MPKTHLFDNGTNIIASGEKLCFCDKNHKIICFRCFLVVKVNDEPSNYQQLTAQGAAVPSEFFF